MSDLIDREAVREFIKSYSHSTDVVYHMEKQLYEVPTIDAVPVVHGYWINWKDEHQCSVCKNTVIMDDYLWMDDEYEFCPNCGARMDGERS